MLKRLNEDGEEDEENMETDGDKAKEETWLQLYWKGKGIYPFLPELAIQYTCYSCVKILMKVDWENMAKEYWKFSVLHEFPKNGVPLFVKTKFF